MNCEMYTITLDTFPQFIFMWLMTMVTIAYLVIHSTIVYWALITCCKLYKLRSFAIIYMGAEVQKWMRCTPDLSESGRSINLCQAPDQSLLSSFLAGTQSWYKICWAKQHSWRNPLLTLHEWTWGHNSSPLIFLQKFHRNIQVPDSIYTHLCLSECLSVCLFVLGGFSSCLQLGFPGDGFCPLGESFSLCLHSGSCLLFLSFLHGPFRVPTQAL